MAEKVKKLIKPFAVALVIIFAVCCWIEKPEGFGDYSSYVGYAISGVTLLFCAYDLWLWRWNPLEDTPALAKKYSGVLEYKYNGIESSKQIQIRIRQTLLSVIVQAKTDINASSTITGVITKEYDKYVLYYTYITDPDAKVAKTNPVQHGTCRMVLDDVDHIKGKYWTSGQTIGDITWNQTT